MKKGLPGDTPITIDMMIELLKGTEDGGCSSMGNWIRSIDPRALLRNLRALKGEK